MPPRDYQLVIDTEPDIKVHRQEQEQFQDEHRLTPTRRRRASTDSDHHHHHRRRNSGDPSDPDPSWKRYYARENRSTILTWSIAILALVSILLILSRSQLYSWILPSPSDPKGGAGDIMGAFKPVDRQLHLPLVDGSKVELFTFLSGASGKSVEIPVYVDSWHNQGERDLRAKVKRIIVHCHGRERLASQAWSEASHARSLVDSSEAGETLIISPLFFNGYDKEIFGWKGRGSTGNLLVWKGNGWGDGSSNQYPIWDTSISSFEVLDLLALHLSDKRLYPNVEKLVFSGHSLGGQLMHRYSILGQAELSSGDVKISFVSFNPATLLYFDNRRKGPACQGMNEYKYGFEKIDQHLDYGPVLRWQLKDPTEYLKRYKTRRAHLLHGMEDQGTGDERPPAMAQGSTRLQRAKNYSDHLETYVRSENNTVDFVPKVSHDGILM
ncbi:hypothetical protein IE53DRAFT_367177 [Violaceomyces palustris]|uniref:Uncharacterized protein n=1 Tax=Violaceomyces palustris TaxID=1673888 RepID=A0ACD0P350_9BASI|nr:hypothetical protein IE53DRAFT_367177 [Violaceomyces palustris]